MWQFNYSSGGASLRRNAKLQLYFFSWGDANLTKYSEWGFVCLIPWRKPCLVIITELARSNSKIISLFANVTIFGTNLRLLSWSNTSCTLVNIWSVFRFRIFKKLNGNSCWMRIPKWHYLVMDRFFIIFENHSCLPDVALMIPLSSFYPVDPLRIWKKTRHNCKCYNDAFRCIFICTKDIRKIKSLFSREHPRRSHSF